MQSIPAPPSKKLVTLHIGEVYASAAGTVIYTLLGSCVAVCLYDPVHRVGGMNHILLPGRPDIRSFDAPARYGINAMELLINRIMQRGGDRRLLVAKVFGGAHVLPSIPLANGMGQRIAAFVVEFLKNEAIRIIGHDLGGECTRKIYFHSDSGEVFLKRVRGKITDTIQNQENQALQKVKKLVRQPGRITWFQ